MGYRLNKGVGAPLDFFGLKSQYIAYFIVGMVLAFLAYFVFQFESKVLAVAVAGVIGLVTYFGCHWANTRFGRHGVSILMGKRMLPNRISTKRARDIVRK
ncbi:MAG: DUF4133 domain-containing protein [Paludibacteraceae bacterium]|nr:DUF4133 domain-containing protein [Paludibacteraceae bacterium]